MIVPNQPSYFRRKLIERAEARREEIREHPIFIDENTDLFDEQRAFINDKARFKVAVCSRRAGKTSAITRKLRKVATGGWEHNALYIARTTDAAKRIAWNMLLQVLARYHRKTEYKTNASELSVYFNQTNSFIWLKGANDSTQIHKLLGVKLKYVCIDEAQSFPAYLDYLIEEILAPSLADLQGEMALTGTPNPTCSGGFYDRAHLSTWAQYHWSIKENTFFLASAQKENPEITSIDDVIHAEAGRRGVQVSDPSIQRDYFGLWVKSTELQVYKYVKEKQDYTELPDVPFEVVLGVDIGFDDSDAIVAIGYSKKLRECYLIEEYKQSKSDITTLAEKIKYFVAKYSPYACVVDAGALGKKIAAELSARHNLALTPADKLRKAEHIELINDDLRNGRIKIKAKSKTASEMQLLCWDQDYFAEGKFVENPDFDNHLCDAVIYSWFHIYSYLYKEDKSPQLTYAQKDELQLLERFKREKQRKEGFIW